MTIVVGDWVKYSTLHGELKVMEVLFIAADGTWMEGADAACHRSKVIAVRPTSIERMP